MKNNFLKFFVLLLLVFGMYGCSSNTNVTVPEIDKTVEIETELKELGYSDSEISSLKEKLDEDKLDILTQYDYVNGISDLINHEQFDELKLENYLKSYFSSFF